MPGELVRENIRQRLCATPHLIPVFTNTFSIPERLAAYDGNLFVVWNTNRHVYEVHSLAHIGSTFGFAVPYDDLDGRTIDMVRELNLHVRGDIIFKELDDSNEQLKRSLEQKRRNDINAQAREMAPYFRN